MKKARICLICTCVLIMGNVLSVSAGTVDWKRVKEQREQRKHQIEQQQTESTEEVEEVEETTENQCITQEEYENFNNENTTEEDKGSCIGVGVIDANIQGRVESISGTLVTEKFEDSPASNSDLDLGDLITGIDGHEITCASEMIEYLKTIEPNTEITITVTMVNQMGYYKQIDYKLVTADRSILNNPIAESLDLNTEETYGFLFESDDLGDDNYTKLQGSAKGYYHYKEFTTKNDYILYHDTEDIWYVLMSVETNEWQQVTNVRAIDYSRLHYLSHSYSRALSERFKEENLQYNIIEFTDIKDSEIYKANH